MCERKDKKQLKEKFLKDGYVVVERLVNQPELKKLQSLCDKLLTNQIDASKHRHDLGGFLEQKVKGKENICQIMWPSLYEEGLREGSIYDKTIQLIRYILGEDMEVDFDMLIAKDAGTDTVTPIHQDESYWPDLPDKRAVTVWIAMDESTLDNGCLWFTPGSHHGELLAHQASGGKHALTCPKANMDDLKATPISAGWCTVHHGRTIHYAGGNSTDSPRRAFIINLRPRDMIKMERQLGFDHGFKGVENVIENTNVHKN